MRRIGWICLGAWLWPVCATASTATYWNVFNIEGESAVSAAFVTYGTLNDMLRDQNRTGLFEPAAPFGRNIVGSGSDGDSYWNVFNIQGESVVSAAFVTYGTLNDMLRDQNRTGLFEPAAPFGRNIVGSGSDGDSYWNVFNIEGESAVSAAFVTYGKLDDMLRDQNRTGLFEPAAPFGRNIVGSGSDGDSYWNVFNIEGESAVSAAFVTYGKLDDMLRDQNRTGLFEPAAPFGRNIVGSGASVIDDDLAPVPTPASLSLLLGALLLLRSLRVRRRLASDCTS